MTDRGLRRHSLGKGAGVALLIVAGSLGMASPRSGAAEQPGAATVPSPLIIADSTTPEATPRIAARVRERAADEVVGRVRDDAVPRLVADAGDDQRVIVGRQVTLNGMRSEPRGRVGFRWIQTGGPAVRLKLEDGYIFSFVPEEPGLYRFTLLVAAGGLISEPASVEVWAAPHAGIARTAAAGPISTTGLPLDAVLRSALQLAPEGTRNAAALAELFGRIAQRMELYTSYAEVHQELSRQLEAIVPSEPARRRVWIETVFQPLTGRLVDAMWAEGLDLRRPEARTAVLTNSQKARLAELFQGMAEGARAAGAWQ